MPDRARSVISLPGKVALAALAAASLLIVREAVAVQTARTAPAVSLAWKQENPEALLAIVRDALTDPARSDPAQVAAAVQAGLGYDPLDVRLLRAAALVRVAQRDIAGADTLFTLAGKRSRRDPVVESWLFDLAQERGNSAQAVLHADAMLRARPATGNRLFSVLSETGKTPAGAHAIAARLATDPDWRAPFFAAAGRSDLDRAGMAAIVRATRPTVRPATPEEVAPLVTRLVAGDDTAAGVGAWQALATRWTSAPLGDGLLALPRGEFAQQQGGGRMLRLAPDQPRGTVVARALLQLTPGTHRIVDGDGWRLACVGRRRALTILESIVVVPQDCTTQWLTLAAPRGASPEPLAVPTIDAVG